MIIRINNKLSVFLLAFMLFHADFSHALEIAVFKSTDIKPYNDALEGFKKSCGCTVEEISFQDMEHREIQAAIRDVRADAVLAIGMDALSHARLLKNLPVIYTMVPNAPQQQSLSGVSMFIPPGNYLEAINDLFPNAKRIGVVYDGHFNEAFMKEAAVEAQKMGLQLVMKTVSRAADAPALIDRMGDDIDLFWMIPDAVVATPEVVNRLLLFSFQHRVPVFTFSKKYLDMGAAAGITINPVDIGLQTGEIAKKIFREGNGMSPVRVNARKTVTMINRKIARKLGLRVRENIVDRDEDAR